MMTHVNTVLIGTATPSAYTTVDALNAGEIALFDQHKILIKTADEAAKAGAVFVGVCEGKETVHNEKGEAITKSIIRYSMPIQKGSKPHMVVSPYEATTEAKIVITATDVTPEVGHRYVLRLIFRDIYEAPGQFSQPYEVIAETTNPNDLMKAFADKINRNKGSRVIASVSEAVLTLDAKVIDYVDDDYELYRQVEMDAFMWKTIPSGLLSSVTYAVNGLAIAKTPANPGKGNPKIIRDRERAMLGYRGITHRANGTYPYIAPEAQASLDKTYDTVTIEWDNKYLSNDNQYIKTTPLTAEIYVEAGKVSGSTFETALKAFVEQA